MLFRTSRYIFAFLVLLTSTFAYAIDYSSEPVDRTFSVEGRSILRVKNPDGEVRVISRPGNEITIHATKEVRHAKDEQQAINEAEKVKIVMTQSAGHVEVRAEYPRIHFGVHIGGPRLSIKMEISVPPETDLDAEVADGNLDVRDLNGALNLDTGDGEVAAQNCTGELAISSGDGEVRVKNFQGTLQVDNGDGEVYIQESSGPLRVHAGDGDVQVQKCTGETELSVADGEIKSDNCSGHMVLHSGDGVVNVDHFTGNLEARTADGKLALNGIFKSLIARASDGRVEVRAQAGSEAQQDWMLESGDGDIILHLPATFSAKAELSTSDGSITTEIPIGITGSIGRSRVSGVIGDGGKLLQIHTADGDISITGETETRTQ